MPLSITVRAFSPFYVCLLFLLIFFHFILYSILVNGECAMAKTRWHFSSPCIWDGWTCDRSKCRSNINNTAGRKNEKKNGSESIETKWWMQVLQPHRSSAQFCNLMHYVYDGDVVVFDAATLKWVGRPSNFEKWMKGALSRTNFYPSILMHDEDSTTFAHALTWAASCTHWRWH